MTSPPYFELEGVDLVTEGVLTLNKAYELMLEVEGDYSYLYIDKDGAMLLALELLVADDITFVVGQAINAILSKSEFAFECVDSTQLSRKNCGLFTLIK